MIPFGVTYYPDQWPEETWDKTFQEIRKSGLNTVRFGEMAWDWIEPSPGKFDFRGLDKAMNLCAKHGIKVLLGVPTSQVPLWFHRKYPGSRPLAQDGTLYPEMGPRPNVCKDNPNYRKHAEKLARALVSRYKNHPALLMWQLDNEPVYPPLDHTTSNDFCHCEHSRLAFVAWARKKYHTLKELNEVWGMKFWTNTISAFDEIQTPKCGIWEAGSPHLFLDWFRFKTDSLKGWIEFLAGIVRGIDKKHKVGTNGFFGISTRTPDHSLMTEKLDWYGLDVYPMGGRMDQRSYEFILDVWRSFTRGTRAEFHITELQGGQNVRWGYPGYVEGPEIKWWTELAWKHGVQSLLYHNWRPPLFGAETGGFGILQQDGSPTKRLEVIKQLAKTVPGAPVNVHPSRVAIAYFRSSEVQSYQEQGPPRGIAGQWEAVRTDIGLTHQVDSLTGAHQAAYEPGKPLDFIFERDLDAGKLPYKVILMPNAYLLSKKQYKNLKLWVERGGILITEARFGLKDEMGRLYEHPLMEDLLGVKYEYTVPTPKGFFDGLQGRAKKPEIISKKVVGGKVHYANFSLFLEIKNGNKKLQKLVRKLIAA